MYIKRNLKRLSLFLSVFLLLIAVVIPVFTVQAAGTNLIANPTVEAASAPALPNNWIQSKWGANTASLEYKTAGSNGSRSLHVAVTAHTDGDAKWMHDAVAVQPNTSYTYTSWYKSNIDTEIDLQYTDTAGNISYAYVTAVESSVAGQTLTANFVTPANVAKVSVMHVLAGVGTLETDDFSLTETVQAPPADEDNYVLNNSFETANGTAPVNWYKNSWGTITAAFSYETTGRTGNRSAKVTVSSYTSGDAKWFADASPVTGTKSYLYRDYYRSTAATNVFAAFIDASGNYTYQELGSAPASAEWAQYNTTFTAPASAVKVSIYHVLSSVGSLTLDDVSLHVALPAHPAPVVPNASFETATGTMPVSWQTSKWGTNTPTFQYANEGRTGTKSAKVTMSGYQDGDAKWVFDPITSLKSGSQYRFTAWYKTNVTPHAVTMFIMADGSERYVTMPVAQPSDSTTTWQKYSDTFSVPTGAVATSVFMFINQNGWLQTDDYSIEEYAPNGFTQPLLSLTFDDGHEDNVKTALPVLNQYNLKTTQCYATSFVEGKSQAVKNGVLAFQNSGHEICSHTVTHPFLTSVTGTNLTYELQHSKQYLESLTGKTITNFASPYGDYDIRVINELKKYYRSHRSVDEGYNSKDNFNIYSIRVQNILDTTSAQQVSAWIAKAQAEKTWLVLVYHRVADNPGPYDTYTNMFVQHVQAIKSSGITVKTYNDALNEVTAQL